MKFSIGELVKIKKTPNSENGGAFLTHLSDLGLDEFHVETYFFPIGVHGLIVKTPTDKDNEFYGEYGILINELIFYAHEDSLESVKT